MKIAKASLCLLLVAPVATIAQDSTTRRSGNANQSDAGPQNPGNLSYRIGPGELQQFLQEHAPNRLDFLNNLPEMGEGRRRVMRLWMDRLRAMMRVKEQDTELYMKMVRQFELQDEAIGLVKKMRTGEAAPKELREKVAEIVRMGITLREQRIAKLEKQLQIEKDKLAQDQKNEDKLVDSQLESIRKEGRELIKRMNPDASGTSDASK
ncbi:MAG TPA: hypothetical protein VL282_17680 [Tepidisphaeraceae bacterium]|jgi:hypothetical protein|nr:hypothetical protein [Tepidisphaeraceae bacterium]